MLNLDAIIIKGIIAGFSLAAPGEAIGFLCIKETDRNILIGITSGLAAASADLVYGILAIVIFQLSRPYLIGHETILTIIGGLFLCAFGLKRFLDVPLFDKVKSIPGKALVVFIATFIFTLTNCSTILEFMSLFIGFDIEFTQYYDLLLFVTGVFLGSLFWWICLSISDELLQIKMIIKLLRFLNYTSGVIIFSFGLYTLSQLCI
jgi:threonine/homoserine/homoserine lactone efflux protein